MTCAAYGVASCDTAGAALLPQQQAAVAGGNTERHDADEPDADERPVARPELASPAEFSS